jgi:hypothetical protein
LVFITALTHRAHGHGSEPYGDYARKPSKIA